MLKGEKPEVVLIKSKSNLAISICLLVMAMWFFVTRDAAPERAQNRYDWVFWFLSAIFWFYLAIRPSVPPAARKRIETVPQSKIYLFGTVLFVGAIVAFPLWHEFYEPDQPIWDGFLAVFLAALVAGTFFGVRYFQKNRIEFGEGRLSPGDADAP